MVQLSVEHLGAFTFMEVKDISLGCIMYELSDSLTGPKHNEFAKSSMRNRLKR